MTDWPSVLSEAEQLLAEGRVSQQLGANALSFLQALKADGQEGPSISVNEYTRSIGVFWHNRTPQFEISESGYEVYWVLPERSRIQHFSANETLRVVHLIKGPAPE